jgi:DNA repair protein RecO (recombination protein O)
MTRVVGERGVILHTRPYRESSLLVNVLTQQHGRIAAVAKGVRRRNKGNELQPFNQVSINWSGRSSLVTLTAYEGITHPWFKGDQMAAAFYVVELVTRLLGENEAVPRVFAATAWVLESLELGDPSVAVVLRSFEKLFLEELGYGVDFSCDADSGAAVNADSRYALVMERGFVAATESAETFLGADLLAIAQDDYRQASALRAAKLIFRRMLAVQLGSKPLASRGLLLRRDH